MHYIVDGYNLIFRLLYSSSPLQEQRAKIIKDISEKAKLLKLNITIVFDSSFQTGESTRTHINDVEIIYTAQYESADDFIINLLKHKDKNNTVITSDQRLAWRARRQNAHSETVEDFIRWLNKRYQNKKLNPQPKQSLA
jgi:predicted RNA-binding protein with PIN domain